MADKNSVRMVWEWGKKEGTRPVRLTFPRGGCVWTNDEESTRIHVIEFKWTDLDNYSHLRVAQR